MTSECISANPNRCLIYNCPAHTRFLPFSEATFRHRYELGIIGCRSDKDYRGWFVPLALWDDVQKLLYGEY